MPHQQKLVHIQDITGVPPGGGIAVINPGLLYNAQNNPSLAVTRHKMSVEAYGADPGGDYRWYLLIPPTPTQVVLILASTNGGYNVHVVIKVFHSICFDISSAEQPY